MNTRSRQDLMESRDYVYGDKYPSSYFSAGTCPHVSTGKIACKRCLAAQNKLHYCNVRAVLKFKIRIAVERHYEKD